MSHKRLVVMLLVITLVGSTSAPTAISAPAPPNIISRGPTEIPHGITLHQDDITMANEFLAVTIAVGTTPWFDIPVAASWMPRLLLMGSI